MSDDHLPSRALSRRSFLVATGGTVAGISLLSLAGCGGNSSAGPGTAVGAAGAVRKGGVLQFAITDSANTENLDPIKSSYTSDAAICAALYEGLVKYDSDWKVSNVLAQSVTPSKDLKSYVVALRPDVKFHDGSPLTAKDVIYSIGRNLDAKGGSPIQPRIAASLAASGMTAVDDHTVKFTLKRADSLFPLVLGAFQCQIVKDGTTDFSKGVGTGPFMLKSFNPGSSWEVTKNASYWDPQRPYLDGIRTVIISDQGTKTQSVLSGQSDLGDQMDPAKVAEVKASGTAVVQTLTNRTFLSISMDASQKPFDNPKVVQAVKFAMDRKLMVATAQAGQGTTAGDTPAPQDDPFYPTSTVGNRQQDTTKAKQLLSEAGYPNGIDIELYTSDVFGGMVDMATVFAKSVEPAGIRVKINKYPSKSYWDDVWLKKPMYTSYYHRRHPNEALNLNYSSDAAWNEGHFKSPELDALLSEGMATADPAKQKDIYSRALAIVADGSGMSIPYFINLVVPAKKRVQGVDYAPQYYLFDRAWLQA